jgi:protein-L-isoaspartate(D-aspartate) O-methyltransferase
VLAAFEDVARERFVPEGQQDLAYSDKLIRLGGEGGRMLLSPMVLGRFVQALEVRPGARVLDVASGYGYTAAVLGRLGAEVIALESEERLAEEARRRLGAAGNVSVVVGPLAAGWPEGAPYDAILVNGAVEVRPEGLLAQLSPKEGRLVCVEGQGRPGRAMLYVRSGEVFGSRPLFDAAGPVLEGFRAEPGFVF